MVHLQGRGADPAGAGDRLPVRAVRADSPAMVADRAGERSFREPSSQVAVRMRASSVLQDWVPPPLRLRPPLRPRPPHLPLLLLPSHWFPSRLFPPRGLSWSSVIPRTGRSQGLPPGRPRLLHRASDRPRPSPSPRCSRLSYTPGRSGSHPCCWRRSPGSGVRLPRSSGP